MNVTRRTFNVQKTLSILLERVRMATVLLERVLIPLEGFRNLLDKTLMSQVILRMLNVTRRTFVYQKTYRMSLEGVLL